MEVIYKISSVQATRKGKTIPMLPATRTLQERVPLPALRYTSLKEENHDTGNFYQCQKQG
ncbi:hypothetical protein [Prevotella pallens]|uniref:hypothetical protein n=1 Tax=Prevotella pallens TaxID=60133 RepID=UPI0028E756E8|nr:hypothetical protein [Prevotella pallens]